MRLLPRNIRLSFLSAVLIASLATPALAQLEVPAECVDGEGTYSGDLSGDVRYYNFGNPSRKVFFFEGDLAKQRDPQSSGGEVTFRDIASDGSFTASSANALENVVTVEGTYADCGVMGTWRLDFGDGRPSLTGTLELGATASSPGVVNDALCGAMGPTATSIFGAVIAGAITMRSRRRRVLRKS